MTKSAGFRLKAPLGSSYNVNLDDVLPMKKALNRAGYYPIPTYGLTRYPDEAMFKGIKTFQRGQGLTADGVVRPGDDTEAAMGRHPAFREVDLVTSSDSDSPGGASSGHHGYDPNQPRDYHGRWTYAGGGHSGHQQQAEADTGTKSDAAPDSTLAAKQPLGPDEAYITPQDLDEFIGGHEGAFVGRDQ